MDNNRNTTPDVGLKDTRIDTPRSQQQQSSKVLSTRNNYQNGLSHDEEEALIRYNHITYLLYALSFFTAGLMWIVPIIMNYARRDKANNTWLASHFDWQIKTFWYSIIFAIIGIVIAAFSIIGLGGGLISERSDIALGSTGLAVIGGLLFVFAIIWHIYRIVKGWIALSDKRPVL